MIDDYLEFKLIGNLWKIINKRGCFSFEQMVEGNNFNKWCFVPVSRCSGDWKKNINNDYTLNYNEVTPLKKIYTDDGGLEVRESVNYPPIELYMQSYDNGGLTVQVSSATPIVEIGNVAQDMAGVFIVNKVTNVVLAFCILPESFKVYNFISFLYDGYLLEINNPIRVDKPKLPDITKLDTNLTITLDKDSYYIDDIISFNGVLKSSDGKLVKGAEVLFNEKRYITNDNGEFSDTVKASLNLTLDFIYGGSSAYNECSQSVSVQVSKIPVPDFRLTVDKDTGVVGDTLTFTPHLPSGATGSIVYTICGVEYTKNVGQIVRYKFIKTGSFTVSAVYSGDESYQGATASVLVTISKTPTVLTCTVDKTSVTVGENVLCTLYLKDNQNNPLTNKTVYTGTWSKTTDDVGRVIFNYANSVSGTQKPVFKFDGDNLYNGASVTAKWTVNKKPVTLTVTADKTSVTVGGTVTLTATVKSDGVNVNEGQVDFGDGVLVDVSNGTAVKTFTKTTPSVLTVTPSYKGTSTYTTATASSLTLTWVEEPVTPEITISADTLIGEVGDDLPITLSSNLKNTALTVLLNDAEVADGVTTDSTGNAVFNYNCNGAGDVNVKVKYLNGTNVHYSNILQVEDCVKYGFKASDAWINPTGHSATNTVADGVFTSTSNSNKGDSILQLDLTGDFIITYDAQWQASTRCGVGAKDTTRTKHFDSGTDTNFKTQKYIYWNGSKETETHYSETTQTTYYSCKIIKSAGHLKGYMNEELVCDLSYPWISQCMVWNFHTTIWNSSTIKIKNLKIKSYST